MIAMSAARRNGTEARIAAETRNGTEAVPYLFMRKGALPPRIKKTAARPVGQDRAAAEKEAVRGSRCLARDRYSSTNP